MRGKIVLAVVLCLAVAALLGIAPAPAAAQDGCTVTGCHTTPASGDAPAPHVPYVASVTDCTVCHSDWTGPPHPEVAKALRFSLSGGSTAAGYKLSGFLFVLHTYHFETHPWGHPGVVVYLQQRLWGATEWTDLTQVTTADVPLVPGSFTYTVASPASFAAYRAIAQGHVGLLSGVGATGNGLFLPKRTTLRPTPKLTLALSGLAGGYWTPASVSLGYTVTIHGIVKPTDLGGKVSIRVQKRNAAGHWVHWVSAKRAISSTGTYSWKWTPRYRGSYRAAARIPATVAHRAADTGFQMFRGWGWFNIR